MRATFQNSGMLVSIGLFFSLMIAGLASALPRSMSAGLIGQGVPAAVANQVSHLPPVGSLFAAFLGYNPMKNLLGPVLNTLPAARASYITGTTFFPQLISEPFMHGLRIVFSAAVVMSLVAAAASWLRGEKYVHAEEETAAEAPGVAALVATDGVVAAPEQTREPALVEAPHNRTRPEREVRIDSLEAPGDLRGKLGEALLAFSAAQPALAAVRSALASGRPPRPDDLAAFDRAASTLADIARPLGIDPARATLGEVEARLAAWEEALSVRHSLRRLAAASGPAVAVAGLGGLSAEADRLAEAASWSSEDESRASVLVELVELSDVATNGGDDERILSLDAELRTALGPGAASVVLAAARGRLALPPDPLVNSPGPGRNGPRNENPHPAERPRSHLRAE